MQYNTRSRAVDNYTSEIAPVAAQSAVEAAIRDSETLLQVSRSADSSLISLPCLLRALAHLARDACKWIDLHIC